MPVFNAQKKSARNLVLCANKQATFGEVFADAKFVRRQRFDGAAPLELPQLRRSDKDYSGKGTQFATEGQISGFDSSKFGLKCELDSWIAGYAFAFAMGADTVTGSGAPYTHSFTFDESSSIVAVSNIYLEDTNDVKYKVSDMAVSDLTITIPGRGACMLELGLTGTGRYTLGPMIASLPALVTPAYILGSDAVFSIGATGAPAAINGRLLSSTIKIETNAINHVAPGGGLYGQFIRPGLIKTSVSAVIAAQETDDIFTLVNNDTASEMKWVVNSGAQAQMTIDCPNIKLKANKLGVDGNMVIWNIESDETTMFGASGNQPLTVQVINGVAAYLTAV